MDLIAQNLSYKPEQEFHLNDVSFSMKKGQLYTILGRTLAGKTTLLKTIAGLLTPQQGTLTLDGQDFATVPVWQRNIAMVYQQFINYPHLSVFENVAFPLRQRKMDNTIINTKVMSALQNVGLMGFEDRKIQALSGGQQQRLCIARAIAVGPDVLLMDEPCSALDPIATSVIEELISELQQRFTILIVTHSMQQAARVSQKTAYFHLGTLVEYGDTKDVFTLPKNEQTEAYISGKIG